MEKHVIMNISEECQCIWCGWPMYQGETALYHEEEPYCSKWCIEEEYISNKKTQDEKEGL